MTTDFHVETLEEIKEAQLCVPSFNLPEPYSSQIYEICEAIESDPEHGLNNGACALYWHLVGTFHMHWGKRKV